MPLSPTPSAPAGDATSATPSPSPSTTAAPAADPASIQALIDHAYDGRNLKLGAERGSTSAYRQHYATYQGDGLEVEAGASLADPEGVDLRGAAVEVAAAPPAVVDEVTPDPDGTVVVGVWLPVEHAPARAATSPVTASTRHTRAAGDR